MHEGSVVTRQKKIIKIIKIYKFRSKLVKGNALTFLSAYL